MSSRHTESDFETTDCILCGGNEYDKLCSVGQHGLPAHVALCKTCGLGFLNPRWTEERYSRFYASEYDKYYRTYLVHSKGQKGAVNQLSSSIPALVRMKSAGIQPSRINHLLDIGSGSGGFISQMRSVYPDAEYFAIEPSRNCRDVLESINVSLISESVNTDWEQSNLCKFDFINMRHVLEHFLDPLNVLRKVRAALTDDGLLYIAVPNSAKPGLPLLSYFFRAVHTFYFNRETLTALAKRAGLQPKMVIEGDAFNRHELVIVFCKGEVINEVPAAYTMQAEVFAPIVRHENSFVYRLKQSIKKLTGSQANNTVD